MTVAFFATSAKTRSNSMAGVSSPTSAYRAQMVESLEDIVSGELMTQAVTLIPCGHVFNEDTVLRILAGNGLCPNDRTPIQRHIPNYTIRDLAQTTHAHPEERAQPREEEPTEEAYAHFARAKTLSEQDDYEGGIASLLQALQVSPHFQKAQAYLDFCLSRAAEKEPLASSSKVSSNPQGEKDKYTELLLTLLEHPQIQADRALKEILATAVENLMESSIPHLSPVEENHYKWTQKLLGEDRKVRAFVVEKLQIIHGKAPRPQAACVRISFPSVPSIAFGKAKWLQYFGEIGEEPPLPLSIHQILQSQSPIWPRKQVVETHMLVLIPRTVNGMPFTLDALEQLIQHPKQGHTTKYRYYPEEAKKALGNHSPPTSYWILMTKDVLPDSRAKTYADQCALVENCGQKARVPYQVPSTLESATSILLEHVQTGTRLYNNEPWTYTRCQEKVAGWQMAVGGFHPAGLSVYDDFGGPSGLGIACVWRC